jgi:hypothetical protein
MNLSNNEIDLVLEDFPKFELSYETMIHKKVHNVDIMLAIPEGRKCFAWFTSYKEDNVCFIMELNDSRNIINIKIVLTSFNDKLALGTIFYGTLINYNSSSCFCIEDIYFYKGKNYTNKFFPEKLETIKEILKNDISQNVLTNKFTIFGLPLISTDFNLILKEIEMLPYKINQIKYRFFEKHNSRKIVFIKYFKPGSKYANNSINNNNDIIFKKSVFKVTPDIEPDIYNLFINKNGNEEYHDIAFIPDYKTSVMMNKLFRNIKENDNLDALEESDDDAEFEDKREDKFVYLERDYKMICEYNQKFKRWCPISLACKNDNLVSFNQNCNKKY